MAASSKKIKKLEKYQNGSEVGFIPSINNIFSQGLGIAPNISNPNGNPFGSNPFGGQLTNNIFNTGQDLQGLFGQEFQNQKPMSYSDWLKKGNRNDDLISKTMYQAYEKVFNKQLEDNKAAFEQATPLVANMTALDELNKMSTLEYNKGLKRDMSDVSNDPRGMESRGIFQQGGNPTTTKSFPSLQEFTNKKMDFVNKYQEESEKRQELLRQKLALDGLPEDKVEEVLEIIFTEIPDDLDNDKPEVLQNKLVERIKNETGYFLPNAQKEVTDIFKLDNIYRTTMGDFNNMRLQMENPTIEPKKVSDKKFRYLQQGGPINPLQQALGYKDNSPYRSLPSQVINSNKITMDGVSIPLEVTSNTGERRILQPNSGLHVFKGASSVTEVPYAQNGMSTGYTGGPYIEPIKSYLEGWHNSPQGVAMLNASVDKDDPYGINSSHAQTMKDARNILLNNTTIHQLSDAEMQKRSPGAGGFATSYDADGNDLVYKDGMASHRLSSLRNPSNLLNRFSDKYHNYVTAADIKDNSSREVNILKSIKPGSRVFNEILTHELSHASDFGGNIMPQSDIDLIGEYSKNTDNKKTDSRKGAIERANRIKYLKDPTEVRARLNAVRYAMKEQGVYDPYTERVTKDILKNYKPNAELDQLGDLREIYTDDQILDLLNKISYSNDKEQTDIKMAKNGGSIKFQQGGTPSNDIELQNSKFGGLDFSQKLTHLKVLKDYVQQYGIDALKQSPEDYNFFVQSVREAQLPIQETFITDPVQDPKKDTPVDGGDPLGPNEVEIKDKRKEREKEKENKIEYKDKKVNTLTERLRNPYELTTERVTIFDDLMEELNSQKSALQQEQLYRKKLRDMFSMQQEQRENENSQSNIYTGRGRFQQGGVPSTRRDGTYNEDVSKKLEDLYKSERYQRANRFEKIGMQAEIDPLSFFETGLGIGNMSTGIPALMEGTMATFLSQIGFDLGEDKLKKLKQKSAPNYQGGGMPILNLSGKTNPLRLNPQGMYKFGGLITEGSEYNKRKQPKKNPISGASKTGPMGPKDMPSYDSGIRAIIDQEKNEIIPTENLIPIQTEKGELIVLPTGDVVPVMAKKRHHQMDEDKVTDVAPEGAYILSSFGRVKIKKKEAERVITETGVKPYKLGIGQETPTEKTLGDIMTKKEMAPAEVGKIISNRFPVIATSNPYEAAANTENKINRRPYLEGLIQLSEFDKMRKGIDTSTPEATREYRDEEEMYEYEGGESEMEGTEVEEMMQGGNPMYRRNITHAQDPLTAAAIQAGSGLIQSITSIIGAAQQRKAADQAYRDVLRLSNQSADRQRGQLGLGAAAGILGTLSQDPTVNAAYLNPTYINQMQTRTPSQITDSVINTAYANMPTFSNLAPQQQILASQAAWGQALKAAGDARMNAWAGDRTARNQQLQSLQQYYDTNENNRVAAQNATRLNRNQQIGNVGDRTQGYFDSTATIEANLGQTQANARLGQGAAQQQAIRSYTQGINQAIGTAGAAAYDIYSRTNGTTTPTTTTPSTDTGCWKVDQMGRRTPIPC